MPAPMEGPFAAKLKAATEGQNFPKGSLDASAVAEGLDLSGGGKTGREKRRAKHERNEQVKRDSGEGVSGRSVHTRGHVAETVPVEASPESAEHYEDHEKLTALVDQINAVDDRLQALFQEYPDVQLTMIEVGDSGEKADVDVRILAPEIYTEAGRDVTIYQDAEDGVSREVFEQIHTNLSARLVEMQEIEHRFREAAKLPKLVEAAPVEKSPPTTEVPSAVDGEKKPDASDGVGQVAPERRSYTTWDAKELRAMWRKQGVLDRINMVTDQLREWQSFDQKIREFKDGERFEKDLKTRGLGEKFDQVLRLTGRSDGIATRLEEIRKSYEEKGELDQKEAAFLTAIFFDYHELLVVAEGIIAERERETPIVEAEKKERELVAFLDDNYKRIIRSLRSVKTREQFDKLKAEKPDNPISGGEIDVDGLRHLFGDQYPEDDDKLVEKLLWLANKFQAEIDTLYKEAEQKVSAKEEKAARVVDSENVSEKRVSFEDKVTRLKDLLDQWGVLEQEFGAEPLRQAIRSLRRLEKRGTVPPTGKIAKWFAEHDSPNAWQGRAAAADRALLTDDALPGMEAMVQDGLLVAEKLRKERVEAKPALSPAPSEAERTGNEPIVRGDIWEAPATDPASAGRRVVITGNTSDGWLQYRFFDFDDIGNAKKMGFGQAKTEAEMRKWLADEGYSYKERREDEIEPVAASVLTLDRRPVIGGELTEWERMNPVEQNRLRRELFSRKDRFVTGLNERLKRAGVNDGDRRSTVIKYLDEYLPQMIELVVKVPLQDTDREILLRDLKKEIAIT